jgi:hypothetical protein
MRLSSCVAAAVAVWALSLSAVQPPTVPDFKPLEFLVGSCWEGPFPDGKATDEHCFEWVFDRKFIRDRHVVRYGEKPYSGETLYGWDPKEKRLAFWYYNSDGEVLVGGVEYRPDSIVFPTRYETDKGTTELLSVWTRTGKDSYRVSNSQRSDGRWKPLWAMELKRRDVNR